MPSFGKISSGQEARLFTLKNAAGVQVDLTDFGGTITRVLTPDRNGTFADIVLGFDSAAEYESSTTYFGCIVGRVGNRIAHGRFTLDGKTYTLATNDFVDMSIGVRS